VNVTPPHDEGAQEGATDPKAVITILVSTGLLGLLVAGAVDVRQTAMTGLRVAEQHQTAMTGLRVAEQHGQELLMVRGEINQLRQDMLDRTVSRYTAEEQEQYAKYLESRLKAIENQLDRCCKNR
jgi:hypothetical protein